MNHSDHPHSSYYTVGLTGGIASGKSTCAIIFSKLGATVHDADDIAKTLLQPQQRCWQACIDHFGKHILLPNQTINRPLLRQMIFTNKKDRIWLEQLLHPHIYQRLLAEARQPTSTYHLLVIPLLFESSQHYPLQRSCVVTVDQPIQKQRAMNRDQCDAIIIDQMIASQLSNIEKEKLADDCIDNNASLAEVEAQVTALHNLYLKQAKNQKDY